MNNLDTRVRMLFRYDEDLEVDKNPVRMSFFVDSFLFARRYEIDALEFLASGYFGGFKAVIARRQFPYPIVSVR